MKTVLPHSFRPLLLGGGKLARHLHHALSLKGVPHSLHTDARSLDSTLVSKVKECSHVWLLVSDRALEPLARALRALLIANQLPGIPLIHSSAATSVPGALTLHPLMTFGPDLYEESLYDRIPWTLFKGEGAEAGDTSRVIEEYLNHLPNPVRILNPSDRTRYHLSCVMFSNLSLILWEAAARTAPGALTPEDYRPILEQTLQNFMRSGIDALTGPLARADATTLEAHHRALTGLPEEGLYAAFTDYFLKFHPKPNPKPIRKKESLHADHGS